MDIERIAIDSLISDPSNVRKHSDRNIKAVANSLKQFGQQKPIVVLRDGTVIAGNATLQAAKSIGWTEIAIIRTELEGNAATAFAIADNRTAELAAWDDAALAEQLKAMDDDDLRLAAGFDSKEFARLMMNNQAELEEDEVPSVPDDPITKRGNVWILGNHRLMCGDSTNVDDVAQLMDGNIADICFTSPPYGLGQAVKLRGNSSKRSKQSAYDTHDDDPAEWAELMDGWWNASLQAVEHAWIVNVQPLAANKRDLMRWINARVDRLIDIITWDKGHAAPQIAPGVLTSQYEWMIGIGKNAASRSFPLASWQGTLSSVYAAPPQRTNDYASIHLATMPIHLPAWIMASLCDQSKSVYEPFCGTGTTLIAAEQLGRTCYAMEISAAYCDVIVKRWETLTGMTAELQK